MFSMSSRWVDEMVVLYTSRRHHLISWIGVVPFPVLEMNRENDAVGDVLVIIATVSDLAHDIGLLL